MLNSTQNRLNTFSSTFRHQIKIISNCKMGIQCFDRCIKTVHSILQKKVCPKSEDSDARFELNDIRYGLHFCSSAFRNPLKRYDEFKPLNLKFSVKSIDPASSFETFTSALSWKINQNYNECCHSADVLMWLCGILASKVTRSNYIFGNEISCTEERRDCTEKMHIFIECMECFIITRCIRMQMKSTKAFVE